MVIKLHKFISYFLIFFLFSLKTTGQVKIPETIVYGTVYNIFHDEYATDGDYKQAIAEDIKNIKEANFNLVMPFPFGQWNVETKLPDWVRTDFLVDEIDRNNLMLMPIMLKSTHRAYLPMWKWLEIPDAVREFPEVSRTTEDVKYTHLLVMKMVDDYFKSVVERYDDRSSLVGYNIWNEPHYESMDSINIARFQDWLKLKYGDLKKLNRVWAEDYTEWDQVSPLMRRTWESSMAVIDWDLFRYANNGEIAKWTKQTIRKYDKKRFITINPVGTVVNNPEHSQWTIDGRQIAPHADVFGISFYPDKYAYKHKKSMPYWRYSCMYDVTRSDAGDKPYYLVEAQTNQQNGLGLFQFMSYEDIHLMSWMAFADDCKGIVFWKWNTFYRGQQAFGRGLTLNNGELAPRGEAAKEVGAVLKKYGSLLFGASVKHAEVGILYDIVALQKSMEGIDRPESENTTDFFIQESFEGTYKALFERNISTDVIRTDMPLDLGQLKKYKILFLPYQLVIRPEVSDILSVYVKDGGWIVADARTAIMDQYDFGFKNNPGAGLDKVFASRRLDLYAADSLFEAKVVDSGLFTDKISDGFDFQGIYFKEKLQALEGGNVIANFTDGDPAMIANKYGKGMAVLSAVPLGGSYYNDILSVGDIIGDLAIKAGAMPAAEVSSSEDQQIMVKVHENEKGETLVYLINLSPKSFNGEITISDVREKIKRATEITEDKNVDFISEKGNLILDIRIPSNTSKVVWVQ